jgi:hypothetical protein
MKAAKVRVNLREFNITQFATLEEAQSVLPPALLLQWVNACWQSTQVVKIADALGTKRPRW